MQLFSVLYPFSLSGDISLPTSQRILQCFRQHCTQKVPKVEKLYRPYGANRSTVNEKVFGTINPIIFSLLDMKWKPFVDKQKWNAQKVKYPLKSKRGKQRNKIKCKTKRQLEVARLLATVHGSPSIMNVSLQVVALLRTCTP